MDVEESQYIASIKPSYGINVSISQYENRPDIDLIQFWFYLQLESFLEYLFTIWLWLYYLNFGAQRGIQSLCIQDLINTNFTNTSSEQNFGIPADKIQNRIHTRLSTKLYGLQTPWMFLIHYTMYFEIFQTLFVFWICSLTFPNGCGVLLNLPRSWTTVTDCYYNFTKKNPLKRQSFEWTQYPMKVRIS